MDKISRAIYVGHAIYVGQGEDFLPLVKAKFNHLPDEAIISVTEDFHIYVSLSTVCDALEWTATNYYWSQLV